MDVKEVLNKIKENIVTFISQNTPESNRLWRQFIQIHPADIALFIAEFDREDFQKIFIRLPKKIKIKVFESLPDSLKVYTLSFLNDEHKAEILRAIPIDELTDLVYSLSDQELKKYLGLLSIKDRQTVLSLMKFNPESAGGVMNTDVVVLHKDFTVEKSIHVLQRLQPRKELHEEIYVTDENNKLVGHIRLEDLVFKDPKTRLIDILHKNDLVIKANEDREKIAKQMLHYGLTMAPVVSEEDYFLGIIPSDTLVDIIEQEAGEDVYRISAMAPIKKPYFETSFFRILFERSYILIILLLAQSVSTMIIQAYEVLLYGFLIRFITMLTSTGGNSSSQTSALVIQGLASGEITWSNVSRFLRREMLMAIMLALLLGIFSFLRVYLTYGDLIRSIAVSISLALIVLVSVVLGSGFPIFLQKLRIDPAFAAGPFLATIMDILGLFIYCHVSQAILGGLS